jgi:hypothetical protein
VAPEEKVFCIFDFIWNELRRAMNDPMKHLPYAPYLMYMIEKVANVRYPKDVAHEPLHHIRYRAKKQPKQHKTKFVGSYSVAPRQDGDLVYAPPPRRSRRALGSMVKCFLKSIFNMCKAIAIDTNENCWDIIEIKSHLGLPTNPYRELPDFDDPFAEWDAQDAAARKEEEEDNDGNNEEDDKESE